MTDPLVIKLGGELIETPGSRAAFAAMAQALRSSRPLAIVHGGGRAIDAELARRGIAPKKVDGIRITDAPTLEAVIAVLAGSANTDLVAALVLAGVPAVGLTGVDAGMGEARKALPMMATTGAQVDLGLVGDPDEADPSLVELLMTNGFVPVVASLGIEPG
ncbi:MAG: acetylglutamate kinase, partial [Acidobacteria bacterium]|nr:acetylglutamate kinase [Acidobacteriota bacterium]